MTMILNAISNWIQALGFAGLNFCRQVGCSGLFLGRSIWLKPRWREIWPLLSMQLYRTGVLSLPIILLSALFIGMVMGLQGYNTLHKFGAESELGQFLALGITRELGPVVTGLLFAGRAGSALTAEIGLMRATEQLTSMKIMGVEPLWHVVAPRFWAGLIAMPVLTILFNVVSIYGGYLLGVHWLGVDDGIFWSNMQQAVGFQVDVVNGLIKSLIFGIMVTWTAVYQGYYANPNAAGISQATTKTVVFSSLFILGLDFVLTAVMLEAW